jgi:hypothetical protein
MRTTVPWQGAPLMKLRVLNLRDLNLAIPYAVQSGFRYPPGLCCQPLGANPLQQALRASFWISTPGVQGSAAPSSRAIPCAQASRFRTTFQVLFCQDLNAFCQGPMRFSSPSCFFAGARCLTIMPVFRQRGRAAHRSDRVGAATAQALQRQITRRPVPPGRRPTRR